MTELTIDPRKTSLGGNIVMLTGTIGDGMNMVSFKNHVSEIYSFIMHVDLDDPLRFSAQFPTLAGDLADPSNSNYNSALPRTKIEIDEGGEQVFANFPVYSGNFAGIIGGNKVSLFRQGDADNDKKRFSTTSKFRFTLIGRK